VLAGALAVVAVFVAALTLAPRFIRTSAGTKPPAHEQPAEVTPAAAPAPGTPINAPASQAATAPPADAPAPATPQTVPAEKAPAASGPEIASKSRVNATAAKRPSSYPSVNEQRAAEVGSASTVPPDRAPPAQDAVAAQPSAPAKPSQEDLEQAQEELLKLNSRASAVAGSVERLQQQQAADGLGLRQDMAGAYARMNTYLHAADADAAEKNLSALQRHIALAEKEISTLERFFSK
jgi:hypothetical protein